MTTTNRFGDMLKEMRDVNTSPQRVEEIVRLFNDLDAREKKYSSWLRFADSNPRFTTVHAGEIQCESSISHIVSYYVSDTPVNIPSAVETTISFNGTTTGLDPSPESWACIQKVAGSDQKFTRVPGTPDKFPFVCFGDFGFSSNATGNRSVYINFFDKDDNYEGSYSYVVRAASGDWTTLSWMFQTSLEGGEYMTMSVYQNSGATLQLVQCDLSFMLA